MTPFTDSDIPCPDADTELRARLDVALAAAPAPAGLADAVLAATRGDLPAAAEADGLGPVRLDAALAAAPAPAGLADAVLAATCGDLPAAADAEARWHTQLDIALAAGAPPAGLSDAVLAATQDGLPTAAHVQPIGRIGFDRLGSARTWAAAAIVALAAGAWWLGPAVTARVAVNDTPAVPAQGPGPASASGQIPALAHADLDDQAVRLLEGFESIDNRLVRVESPADAAADPVGLLGQRLAAVAAAGPWSGSGFDGIDRAIDWETSYETANDGAWLF